MIGFLNVYKPSGLTSNAVVQKIKKRFHIKKIGHMGTLDPLACGILPIAIGKATRMFDYSLEKTKRYTAIFDFGYSTDSLDVTGSVIKENGSIPTLEDVIKVLPNLVGNISQIPPNFSAKVVNGQRAYDLARQGIEFELKPKNVFIYKIDMVEQVDINRFKFDIVCSSGTYIRSIARDLAKLLNTYGCMSFLERTETGVFKLDTAIELDKLLDSDNISKYLISLFDVFPKFDKIEIDGDLSKKVIDGKRPKFKILDKNTFIVVNSNILGVAKKNSEELILDTYLYDEKEG